MLQQINKSITSNTLYLNFEDPRLAGFDSSDFIRLHEITVAKGIHTYFFDEIQNSDKWENFVRVSLDEGYKVFITGANATRRRRERGTKITGRQSAKESVQY